jgi:alpha-N-arabinofuranosidase
MILTNGPEMVLTPTYHVFRMFNVHQNAIYVPSDYTTGEIVSAEGRTMPDFSACASRTHTGLVHVSLANPNLDKAVSVELNFDELKPSKVSGEILKADRINAYNAFGKEPAVAPAKFTTVKATGKSVKLTLPAASIVVLEVQ